MRTGMLAMILSSAASASVSLDAMRRDFPKTFHRTMRLSAGVTHFDDQGPADGPAVVLVHGVSGPLAVWDATVPALVKKGFRVLRYDLYGRGYSDRPAQHSYRLADFLEQLEELVEKQKLPKNFFLVGSSFGAVIASEFALHHPERVRGLALLGPAGFPIETPVIAKLRDVPVLGNVLFRLAGRKTIEEQNRKYFHLQPPPAELWDYFKAQLEIPGTAEAMRDTLRAAPVTAFVSSYRNVGKTDVPVAVLWGTEDATFPYANHVTLLDAIPSATLTSIHGAAHLPQVEKADVTNAALLRFFEGQVTVRKAKPSASLRRRFRPDVQDVVPDGRIENDADFSQDFFAKLPSRKHALDIGAGPAREYYFPTFYDDVTVSVAVHTCSVEAAALRLAHTGWAPVSAGPGKAIVILSSYRYGKVRGMAPYSEVAVTIPAIPKDRKAPPFLPLLRPAQYEMGAFVAWMPVTTKENQLRGRAIWGLPKDVVPIELAEVGDDFVTTVWDDRGEQAFRFSVPTKGRTRKIHQELSILSRKDGELLRSITTSEGDFVVRSGPGAPRFTLGSSRQVPWLADLEVSAAPFRTQFGSGVRSAFALPLA